MDPQRLVRAFRSALSRQPCSRLVIRSPDPRYWQRTGYATEVLSTVSGPSLPSRHHVDTVHGSNGNVSNPPELTTFVAFDQIVSDQSADALQTITLPITSAQDDYAQGMRKRLGRAMETQNLSAAERLWSSFADSAQSRFPLTPEESAALQGVYEHFLLAFSKLRRADLALEVWNGMINNHLEPTVQTWTIMIKGCQYDHDHVRAEDMWQRMRSAGIRPDLQAWTTRIFGLLRLNRSRQGFEALNEMASQWAKVTDDCNRKARKRHQKGILTAPTAIKPDDTIAPKPNIAVINAAASALASQNPDLIPKVLAWATRFGIEPDVSTYNILINVSLANQQAEEAVRILALMRQRSIACDSATYTILLTGLFHSPSFASLSPQAQTDQVLKLVHELEADGNLIDDRGYALILDRLLKLGNNVAGANRILAHLAATGNKPTAHMYTILMTHYFQRTPPDLKEVNALWTSIKQTPRFEERLDVIFYDRMIEGYASCGEAEQSMVFLARMSRQGKRPGWLALTAVVKCLVDKGDISKVKQIVQDAERGKGLLWAGMRGTKGQAEFWNMIRKLRLTRL